MQLMLYLSQQARPWSYIYHSHLLHTSAVIGWISWTTAPDTVIHLLPMSQKLLELNIRIYLQLYYDILLCTGNEISRSEYLYCCCEAVRRLSTVGALGRKRLVLHLCSLGETKLFHPMAAQDTLYLLDKLLNALSVRPVQKWGGIFIYLRHFFKKHIQNSDQYTSTKFEIKPSSVGVISCKILTFLHTRTILIISNKVDRIVGVDRI